MTSLRSLLAAYEGQDASPASASIAALEKMVALQKDALDQALADLQAARAKQGVPELPSLPDLPESGSVQATVEFVLRADRRRRGEEFIPAAPAQPFPAPPSTPQARAEIAQFIINADKKARGEK